MHCDKRYANVTDQMGITPIVSYRTAITAAPSDYEWILGISKQLVPHSNATFLPDTFIKPKGFVDL